MDPYSNRQIVSGKFYLLFITPTFYALPAHLQVFLEAESAAVEGPHVFALASVAAEPSPEVVFVVDLETAA
jgi:hypothetical protein